MKHIHQHELDTADRLSDLGHDVTFLPASEQAGKRTADILLDGRIMEIKCPTGASRGTVSQVLRGAQADTVVLDTARTSLASPEVLDQIIEAMRRYPRIREVLMLHDGVSTVVRNGN